MAKSIYLDKMMKPEENMMGSTLGETKQYWQDIIEHITKVYAYVSYEWKYYGIMWGWSCVIKSKAKTLCYLIPVENHFYTAIIFNDKGRALTIESDLPQEVKTAVEATKNNPKNIPYDFCIFGKGDVEIARNLIAIRAKT